MSTPTRPLFNSGRESPFKRQNSTAVRGSTPTRDASSTSLRASTPTRDTPSAALHRPSSSLSHSVSPTKNGSLSPEKASPFVRRPSQHSPVSTSRPSSPFARSNSVLGLPTSPSRSPSRTSSGYDGEKRGSFSLAREASSNSMSFSRQNSLAPEPIPEPEASPAPTERTVETVKTAIDLPLRSLPAAPERETSFSPESPSPYDGARASPAPVPATLDSPFDGARSSSRPNLFESPTAQKPASQLNLRPTAQRTVTSSTTTTLRQPNFAPSNTPNPSTTIATTKPTFPAPKPSTQRPTAPTAPTGTHQTHLPAPLLHSLRESFEVLDTTSTNTLTPASLASALEASGLDPSSLPPPTAFFPPGGPQNLNLSTYLSSLSAPLAQLSSPEELAAAFGAFDLEDSGEVDVEVLREAVMGTGPEGEGEEDFRLSEGEVEAVLRGFVGRRAFTGARGLGSPKKSGGRGEVFKWREFVGAVGGNEGGAVAV